MWLQMPPLNTAVVTLYRRKQCTHAHSSLYMELCVPKQNSGVYYFDMS